MSGDWTNAYFFLQDGTPQLWQSYSKTFGQHAFLSLTEVWCSGPLSFCLQTVIIAFGLHYWRVYEQDIICLWFLNHWAFTIFVLLSITIDMFWNWFSILWIVLQSECSMLRAVWNNNLSTVEQKQSWIHHTVRLGAGEDSWESLALQGDQTSPS